MNAHADHVRDAYDRWSCGYDTDANPTRDLDAAALRQAALPLAGARVIEFGCGTGKNTAHLASCAAEVIALDFSEGMLARARERIDSPKVRFIRHDITRPWPVPGSWATLIVGNLVLEHIDDVATVFTHARGSLAPGGVVYCCELHPARQLLGKAANFRSSQGEVRIPAYTHTLDDFATAAGAAGLRLTRSIDHHDPAAPPDAPPRLLSMHFTTA